jgi:hypothetical protein
MKIKILNIRILTLILGCALFTFQACQEDPFLVPPDNGNTEETPKSRAFITFIQLNQHPVLDPSGNLWDIVDSSSGDFNGEPDIFFNFSDQSAQPVIFWSQPTHFSNVSELDTLPYYLQTEFEVIPFGSDISVNVYDHELPDSTLMQTLTFFIGEYGPPSPKKYPDAIIQVLNGYSIMLGLRWEE